MMLGSIVYEEYSIVYNVTRAKNKQKKTSHL